jgi:hypothetical protein
MFVEHSKMMGEEQFSLSFGAQVTRMRDGKPVPCTYPSLDGLAVRFSNRNGMRVRIFHIEPWG